MRTKFEETALITAESLLQIKAIKLDNTNPFTWASGIKSPIYCDNRKTLSYPEIRNQIKNAFIELIQYKYPDPLLWFNSGRCQNIKT